MNFDEIRDNILNKLSIPHAYFPQENIGQKKTLARHIFSLKNEYILLPTYFAFSYTSIIAGLSEKHIEYVAKNAPVEYKKELATTILNKYKMKEVFEIAKAMDEDLGENLNQNQQRIKRVYQYICDNWSVFQI